MQIEKDTNIVKVTAVFVLIALLLTLIYVASDILFPLVMAFLFAILIRPISKFLNEKLRFPKIIAISFTLLLALSFVVGLILFLTVQISEFLTDLPTIKHNLNENIRNLQVWISQTIGLTVSEQETYVGNTVNSTELISSNSLNSISNSFLFLVLIPIYTFLILNYRSLLLGFLLKIVPSKNLANLQEILGEIKSVIRNYIVGLLLEVLVVAVLTGFGLWLVGVKYAIFLGVFTALLNLIPYIGILFAASFSCFIALSGTTNLSVVIGVVAVNLIVQFIDNNILIPKIVGSKVSINALTSMVGVIIGGSLAGISGMFLAIPIIAILKVIFDRVPSLKPYGYVMGDDVPKSFDWNKFRIPYFTPKNVFKKATGSTEEQISKEALNEDKGDLLD